jgi:hypothetical protein
LSTFASPLWAINHVIAYGQSYASGWDGVPPLSTLSRFPTLMLGDSVRPAQEGGPEWTPAGTLRLNPLVATMQRPGISPPIPRPGWPALPASEALLGETVLEQAMAVWQARRQASGPTLHDAGGHLLASTCAVGGRTLEELARHAVPPLFNRLRDCVRLGQTAAAEQRLNYGLAALLFLQGESNVVGQGTNDRDAYKRLLKQLFDDMAEELPRLAGQARPPVVVMYQTGGGPYAEDGPGVAQAQLELALEWPGVFLATPAYPYPDARGHLDANGYRWLGAQFGKVLHCVLTLGETWRPLHPLRAEQVAGTTLRLTFAVPHPPLSWGRPMHGQRRRDIPDGGFTVLDAEGAIRLERLVIGTPHTIHIELARPPVPGPLQVRYADRSDHSGCGSLHDSDPAVAEDVFVAEIPGAGYAAEDIAELAGRPYPLVNWCVAFTMPVVRP